MNNLNKHKAKVAASMSRKKVQAETGPMSNDQIDQMGANAPMMGEKPTRGAASEPFVPGDCMTCAGQGGWWDDDGEPSTCDDCGGSGNKPAPAPAPSKRDKRPRARDKRMLGRYPHQTRITAEYDAIKNFWILDACIEGQHFTAVDHGLHAAHERFWDGWLAWKSEQAATKKGGAAK